MTENIPGMVCMSGRERNKVMVNEFAETSL